MASKCKKTPTDCTIAIPVRELAMVAVVCLWSVIFFAWIVPGDGMFIHPKDGETIDDYPHLLNAAIPGVLWVMWVIPCSYIAIHGKHMMAIVASYVTGALYIAMIVEDQTRSQAACLWPPCGL